VEAAIGAEAADKLSKLTGGANSFAADKVRALAARGELPIAAPRNEEDLQRLATALGQASSDDRQRIYEHLGIPANKRQAPQDALNAAQDAMKERNRYLANPQHVAEQIESDEVSKGAHDLAMRFKDEHKKRSDRLNAAGPVYRDAANKL